MGFGVYEDREALENGVSRWAGYMVPGICDMTGCDNPLPMGRGLGNKCETRYTEDIVTGDEVEEQGCGLFFCGEHAPVSCPDDHIGLTPKPDTSEWEEHILTDDSWARWREENPKRTEEMLARSLA